MISTIVVARILSPAEFGLAALVLGVNTIMGAFIGLPFEESLSQRRRLKTAHLETALFASIILTVVAIGLSVVVGPLIEHWANAPGFAIALILSSLLLLWQGPGAVSKAVARRSRRFVEISACQGLSTVIASAVSIATAMAGWGVYSLILQRLLPNVLYPILSVLFLHHRRQRIWIPVRWHGERFREIFRFSWLHLADVGVTSAAPAVLSFMVNAFFGATILGQLNIALRIVDPLRMALMGVGHNLAFSVLVRLQGDPPMLVRKAGDIAAGVAVVAVPAFVGLAASAPVLLPMLVGPGWDEAVSLAQILCVSVGISLPLRFYYSSYSALGRPEYGLVGSIIGLGSMVAGFLLAASLEGHMAAPIAFMTYEISTTLVALGYAGWVLRRIPAAALFRITRIWLAALAMAAFIIIFYFRGQNENISLINLSMIIITGIVTYPLALCITCKSCFQDLIALLRKPRA
ncbi:oligosaccharide flippase family protein [Paracoccus sp. 1_MG-2023]|uniref:oligosaccharide flippase family protein n=1 Tax=unclassified Paracoccus (in: a-proteobacteria) TaxID=2688777 RepID=UPI001C0A5760|nr:MULTISPECIES: oligosaccharide flippase family protein [unclassified Paracoccus (in: a-proteobacteria)]MBU2957916.1 oligosaccharide flippase family protein [Paracoccus sp. C2R09]MDO6668891.1 oligosaccharide flippase family protein [Paracoccus sp. 1_MG-2023]